MARQHREVEPGPPSQRLVAREIVVVGRVDRLEAVHGARPERRGVEAGEGLPVRRNLDERELGKAREIALEELEDWAIELGANAVVGVDIDYESFGQTNGMMMVSATGTAVFVEDA